MKPKNHTSKLRNSISGAPLVTVITLCFGSSALAVDNFWDGSDSNNWNTAGNWSLGVLPVAPDDAVVNNVGNFPIVISSDFTASPRDITVGGGGLTGQVDHIGGNATSTASLFIGRGAGSTGTYNMNTTGLMSTGRFIVGDGGNGTFNFNGGTINSNNEVWVGQAAGGVGVFTMNGGTINSSNWTVVGRNGSTGTLNMNDGSILKTGGGAFVIGDNANGTVIQSGGTVSSGGSEYWIGQGSFTSTHTLNAGILNVGNWLAVGRNGGTGILNQTGGTITKTGGGDLVIGAGGGASTGTVNASGGIMSINSAIQISENGSTATSALNISGTAQVSAATVLVGSGGATGTGNLSITGGTLTTGQIVDSSGISNATFDGGLIVATGIQPNFIDALNTATIGGGNLNIDSSTFAIGVPQLLGGSGGVTKTGSGTLTLTGVNTYAGVTSVNVGQVILSSTTANSGNATVAGSAALGVVQATDNGILTRANATFGTGSVLNINLGNFPGNPTSAPLNVSSALTLNGTVTINVADQTMTTGTFPLVTYGTKAGNFTLGTLPPGVVATLDQSVAGVVSLNVISVANLFWNATASTAWDFATVNWINQAGPAASVFSNGSAVTFDNSATGAGYENVTLGVAVAPSSVTFNNSTLDYTLTAAGPGKITGGTALTKRGTAGVTLNTPSNDYLGVTTLEAGTTSVGTLANGGVASPLGAASASSANLVLAGGTLNYTGGAVTIDRGFTVSGASAAIISGLAIAGDVTTSGQVSTTLGRLVKTGAGVLTLNGLAPNNIGSTNGLNPASFSVNEGGLVLSGSGGNTVTGQMWVGASPDIPVALTLTNSSLSVTNFLAVGRGNGTTNTTSSITATNSTLTTGSFSAGFEGGVAGNLTTQDINISSTAWTNAGTLFIGESGGSTSNLTINGTSNVTVSNGAVQIGNGANATGVVSVSAGTFNQAAPGQVLFVGNSGSGTLNISGTGSVISAGSAIRLSESASGTGTINLDGGTLTARQISSGSAGAGSSTFNFNGGLLKAGDGANADFMALLDAVNVNAGGAFIDSNGNNISTSLSFIDGGGGLTKSGAGTFTYDGFGSYAGSTNVIGGTLAGNGTVLGALDTLAGTILAPGNTVGTFSSGSATIRGSFAIELNGANGDQLLVNGQLDLSSATDSLNITVPGAGATKVAYVIASYSSRIGDFGALITGMPAGYSIDYNYQLSNQIAIVRPVTPFDTFIDNSFPGVEDPAIVGPNADPDGDGSSNKLEFVLGGDPNSGSDGPKVYQLIADSSDGGTAQELLMTIAVLNGTPAFIGSPSPSATQSGFTYSIQGSFDLATFTSPVSAVAPVTTGLPAAPAGYVYRTFSLNGTNGTPNKGFLRVMVNP